MPPTTCEHKVLSYLSSTHSEYTSYNPYATHDLQKAAEAKGLKAECDRPNVSEYQLPNRHSWSFPAPLILPQAALEDPDSEPQNFDDWYTESDRNRVTSRRRTIYLCAAPGISGELERAHHARGWTVPKLDAQTTTEAVQAPKVTDVAQYLSAFYHGLPVKIMNADLTFVSWADPEAKVRSQRSRNTATQDGGPLDIGLATSQDCTRIRTRPTKDVLFKRQLNLNDLLDVALGILPKDAYALCMLVDHDIYEGDDDDFCCGRAYGGSRIAVVSTARYNPMLDHRDGLDYEHAWPGSHCLDFVNVQCESAGCGHFAPNKKQKRRRKGQADPSCDLPEQQPAESPLHQAVAAHREACLLDRSAYELWLGRVCKTTSHELGHCFGLDHCVYYACIMQSTSSCAEDAEQPPYLCPVDHRKVLSATGQGLTQSYEAFRAFCATRQHSPFWSAMQAWFTARLREMEMTPPNSKQRGDREEPILID